MCAYITVNSADTVYLPGTREVTLPIVCHRWGQVATARLLCVCVYVFVCVDLCVCCVVSHRRFHVGAAGVCDRLHHLDGSVLMNILIISLNARACWVLSRPPFPEINMEKRGRGGKALQRGVDSRVMLLLAPRQPNLSVCLTCCHFVIIFDNANIAMFAYLHCQLLTNVKN